MSVVITFEHPLSERVRNFLRIEHLFLRFYASLDNREPWAHHAALTALFEIMDCAARAELKLDILQELERQRQHLAEEEQGGEPAHEQAVLLQAAQNLQEVHQKFGQHLRENEWLMSIKQRIPVSGGTTPFDLPSYHYWLQQPYEKRLADLNGWIRSLTPTGEAIQLLLGILRHNSHNSDCDAVSGSFQSKRLPPNIQMLSIEVGQDYRALPEVSANKYFTHIRFIQASQHSPRGEQLAGNVAFRLKMCSFDPLPDALP